jgi:hypothetical protein
VFQKYNGFDVSHLYVHVVDGEGKGLTSVQEVQLWICLGLGSQARRTCLAVDPLCLLAVIRTPTSDASGDEEGLTVK